MVDKRSHKSLSKALLNSKLDGAYVMELEGRAKMVELKDSFFKKLLNGFIGTVKIFGPQKFLEPTKDAFHNGVVMGSTSP